ncbi:MAG: ketoacyl-ACP synthase III [Deltaproteobacteria bacterium]|nr:ketoacyl-ACP synthase III [Deltaproteobacteria bacterium]MBN2671313.1 ketoacyl-ACP synthase III [Deltaproteobacteria bacterium]
MSVDINTRIIGTGKYKAEGVLTNHDLEKMVDTSDQWITERTGISERRIAPKDVATSDMAAGAVKEALDMAGKKPDDIDMIICGTVTGDMPLPSTAAMIQKKIGASNMCPAFDVSAACAGFIYGLSVADAFIKTGKAKTVAIVGTEMLTRFMDFEDRNTCVLFGDGAGAVIATADQSDRGILSTHLYTDSSLTAALQIPGGGSLEPASAETIANRRHFIQMEGREVFKVAVKYLSDAAETAVKANGYSVDDVNVVSAHQANMRILSAVSKRVNIPLEKFALNLKYYGNTSSASIPISLDEAVREGKVSENDLVLMIALGGGISWGSALIKW